MVIQALQWQIRERVRDDNQTLYKISIQPVSPIYKLGSHCHKNCLVLALSETGQWTLPSIFAGNKPNLTIILK